MAHKTKENKKVDPDHSGSGWAVQRATHTLTSAPSRGAGTKCTRDSGLTGEFMLTIFFSSLPPCAHLSRIAHRPTKAEHFLALRISYYWKRRFRSTVDHDRQLLADGMISQLNYQSACVVYFVCGLYRRRRNSASSVCLLSISLHWDMARHGSSDKLDKLQKHKQQSMRNARIRPHKLCSFVWRAPKQPLAASAIFCLHQFPGCNALGRHFP